MSQHRVPPPLVDLSPDPPTRPLLQLTRRQGWRLAAAAFALAAGFSHALAGEEHFTIWWGYGLFFSIVSICEILGGGALFFWGNRSICLLGIAGTVPVVLLYILTRTVGVPFGPEAGQVEGIGVLDAVSKILELGLIVCLILLLREPLPESTGDQAAVS